MKKADRQKIFDKYGGKCAYCGCELQKGWHVDEIEPVVRNHKWDSEKRRWISDGCIFPERFNVNNQNPACASCNIQKHSQGLEDFRKQIAQFINSLNQYHSIYRFAKRYGLVQETGNDVVFYFEKPTVEANDERIVETYAAILTNDDNQINLQDLTKPSVVKNLGEKPASNYVIKSK